MLERSTKILLIGTVVGIIISMYGLMFFPKSSDEQDIISVLGAMIASICFLLIPFIGEKDEHS